MKPEKFCFITTEAIDHIHLPDNKNVENEGGTKYFYKKAADGLTEFSNKDDNFVWISPPKKTEVHIYPQENYGYGENDSSVDPALFSEHLESAGDPVIIISTTLRTDFDLELLKPYLSKIKHVFIDVQGFTRNGREHDYFNIPDWLLNFSKVTFKIGEEELPYVDLKKILKNENTIVLYTRGEDGLTVMRGKSSVDIQPSEVIKREKQEYRGAGDTFLFHFALHYIQNGDLMAAAEYAEKSVATFLKAQNK